MSESSDRIDPPENRLERLGKRLSEVVHDLRNPLGSILALAELLERDASEEQKKIVRQLRANARSCTDLVDDVLYFSTSREAPVRSLDPAELIKKTLDERPNRYPHIEVRTEVTEGGRPMLSRASDLRRLVLNLVRNAENAMAASGHGGRIDVSVGASENDDFVRIIVSDEGHGFPKSILSGESDGEGLGLGICRRIVAEHRGTMDLSLKKDRGSRVSIGLRDIENAPLEVEVSDSQDASGAASAEDRALSILVVDDDPDICSTYARILSLDDHEVDVCQSGRDGLQLFLNGRYDVALVDVRLPDMNGASFFAEVKKRRPEAADRIVFATGDARSDETQEFLKKTGNTYLIKPFEIGELRAALKSTTNEEKGN